MVPAGGVGEEEPRPPGDRAERTKRAMLVIFGNCAMLRFGKKLHRSASLRIFGGGIARSFEIEHIHWTVQPICRANVPDDRKPSRWEVSPNRSIADRSHANAQGVRQCAVSDTGGYVMSCHHTGHYPQMVDDVKATIWGLDNYPPSVNCGGMSDDLPYAHIGARLRNLRDAYQPDISQKAWAEKHGFNATQYNNWEKGNRRIPVDFAETLCDTYGLTLDFIYRGRRDGLSENARKVV